MGGKGVRAAGSLRAGSRFQQLRIGRAGRPWACAQWFWRAATSASTPRPTPTMPKWLPRVSRWPIWPANPCVWCPTSRAACDASCCTPTAKLSPNHTAASNSLRAYLNANAIRPAKGNLELEGIRQWILKERDWSPLQSEILAEHFADLNGSSLPRSAWNL